MSTFAGRRVYVERVGWDLQNPNRQAMLLSCGHTIPSVSIFWSQGDPVWCEKCTGATCRACGAPATVARAPSLEWGEACAGCADLSEREWVSRVEVHKFDTMPTAHHVEFAQFFWSGAQKTEREAADPKHKFWESPPHLTRKAHVHQSRELFVKALVHVLYLFAR